MPTTSPRPSSPPRRPRSAVARLLPALLGLCVGACVDDEGRRFDGTESSASNATNNGGATDWGTTGGWGTWSTDGWGTAATEATGWGTWDTTGGWGTTTSSTGGGTTSGDDACAPEGLPACNVARCVQSWDFNCDSCGSKVERERCFEIYADCAYPKLDCELPRPCDRVWAYGAEDPAVLDTLDDEGAATCLMKSLRSGESARYEIAWGDMSDGKGTVMEVFVGSDGRVTMQWEVPCESCATSGHVGRTGMIELVEDDYFDVCLEAATTEALLDCVFGFTAPLPGPGLPKGYLPPWVVQKCVELDAYCPG
jgi:hypothetical protein